MGSSHHLHIEVFKNNQFKAKCCCGEWKIESLASSDSIHILFRSHCDAKSIEELVNLFKDRVSLKDGDE